MEGAVAALFTEGGLPYQCVCCHLLHFFILVHHCLSLTLSLQGLPLKVNYHEIFGNSFTPDLSKTKIELPSVRGFVLIKRKVRLLS